MDKKEALERVFNILDIKDEKFIKDLDAISMLISKQKKDFLFLEGETGYDMFFVVKGLVKIYKTNEDGREITISIAQEGDFFAEIVLFLKNKYPVSAVAIENSLLLAINANHLFEKIRGNPEFAMKLLGIFAKKLNYLASRIKELSLDGAQDRLLNYLDSIKDKNGTVHLAITKRDIATAIGISPETLSRIIKKLSDKGILETKGKTIRIIGN